MHGQFTWYELTTPDVEASKKFYSRFTSWGTQAFDNDYTMFTLDGVPITGIFRLTDEMRGQGIPPNWMPYVETSNVDDTVLKARSLGGKVVAGPDDIPNTGRFAVLQDPQGATFGVYKSIHPSNAWNGDPVVDRFSWHELMTDDYAKAFDFYRALFDWDQTSEMDMGGGLMYRLFGQGGKMYGGMYDRVPGMEGIPPFWLVYIHVKDVGKAVAAATKAGAFIQRPRMPIPGGTIAILGDPHGAAFAFHDAMEMPAETPSLADKVAATGAAVKKAASSAVKAVTKAARKAKKAVMRKRTTPKKAKPRRATKVAKKTKRPAPARKRVTKKSAARKATARKAPARKTAARKAPARRKAKAKAKK
jgi:predicted enzyme related to lactoylglutathione lyase